MYIFSLWVLFLINRLLLLLFTHTHTHTHRKRPDRMSIYTNGNKEEPLNYRPVSLTSIVCKICEKVIKKQWTQYLEREGIITDR